MWVAPSIVKNLDRFGKLALEDALIEIAYSE